MYRLFRVLKRHFKTFDAVLLATKKLLKQLDWNYEYVFYLESFYSCLKVCLEQQTSPITSNSTTPESLTPNIIENSFKVLNLPLKNNQVKILSNQVINPQHQKKKCLFGKPEKIKCRKYCKH